VRRLLVVNKSLIVGLGLLAVVSGSLRGQSTSAVTLAGTTAYLSERIEELQQRLDRLKSQLALVKQRSRDPSTTTRSGLYREVDDLQTELEPVKGDLACIRRQQQALPSTPSAALENCCQFTAVGAAPPKGTRSQPASDCGVALEAADCCRVHNIGPLSLPGANGTSREGLSKIELVEAHGPKSLAVQPTEVS